MQIYHQEKMSDEQKHKTKEYDRKKAAAYRLKKYKTLEQSKKEKCRNRQQKCRLVQKSKLIPTKTEISETPTSCLQNCQTKPEKKNENYNENILKIACSKSNGKKNFYSAAPIIQK